MIAMLTRLIKQAVLLLVLFWGASLRAEHFDLDSLVRNPRVFNLPISACQSKALQPSIYSSELTYCITKKQRLKFLSHDVVESALHFSDNKLSDAYLLMKYSRKKSELPELERFGNQLKKQLDQLADKHFPSEQVEFHNHEKFMVYKWQINNSLVLLFLRTEWPGTFVSLRISRAIKQVPSAWDSLKTQASAPVVIDGVKSKILPVPMRRQLPGMGACWNTTMARQLNYAGSSIDQQMVIAMTYLKGHGSEKEFIANGPALGYAFHYQKITKRPSANCIKLAEQYNRIAKAENRPEISMKVKIVDKGEGDEEITSAKYNWGDNFNKMAPDIVARITIDHQEKYEQFKKMVIENIDHRQPVGWTVKRHSGKGRHRRIIIGYDLNRDLVYYTDSWFNCDKRSMPFLAAYCMTVWVQVVKLVPVGTVASTAGEDIDLDSDDNEN